MMINCNAMVCEIYLLLLDWTLFFFSDFGFGVWIELLVLLSFDLDFSLDDCFRFWMLVWFSGFLVLDLDFWALE